MRSRLTEQHQAASQASVKRSLFFLVIQQHLGLEQLRPIAQLRRRQLQGFRASVQRGSVISYSKTRMGPG